ncbi:hypothetical protein C4556_02670 [Candidatus Parcubacteria bacterium]|nr:MAG: hypothetical protein C4556_02670 [Candidatus Parcubacteria bacterium]
MEELQPTPHGLEKGQREQGPELQIVPHEPEVRRIPPDMTNVNVDDFLKKQRQKDKKRDEEPTIQ